MLHNEPVSRPIQSEQNESILNYINLDLYKSTVGAYEKLNFECMRCLCTVLYLQILVIFVNVIYRQMDR